MFFRILPYSLLNWIFSSFPPIINQVTCFPFFLYNTLLRVLRFLFMYLKYRRHFFYFPSIKELFSWPHIFDITSSSLNAFVCTILQDILHKLYFNFHLGGTNIHQFPISIFPFLIIHNILYLHYISTNYPFPKIFVTRRKIQFNHEIN